jgi:2'-5' RNA ligase
VSELRDLSARREGRAVRAFFAWALPEGARAEVAAQARALRARPNGEGVRWVRSEGYHVTLRFLGNVAVDRVPELVSAVEGALSGAKSFLVTLGAPRAFPSERRPRVVVLPLEPEAELAALAERIEGAVVACGLPPEKRRFRGHLTLGRVRGRRLPELAVPAVRTSALAVCDVVLFQSDLGRDGARYTPLARLPLTAEGTVPRPTSSQEIQQGD